MTTPKLPPNQQLVAPGRWPIIGERESDPQRSDEPWRLSVDGLLETPRAWTLEDLRAMPQVERTVDIHCVTRWSKLGARFKGVSLKAILQICNPSPQAKYISFIARSSVGHNTSLAFQDALDLDVLLALTYEDQPLPVEHGGPLRPIVPGRYFYKSLKWLEKIEVLNQDHLGTWEKDSGYHNTADPWAEQRYILPDIANNAEYDQVLKKRDFSGKELLGIRAEDRDLSGLNAQGAQLRDAHFERTNLENACFDAANLSNAHFQEANLRGVTFCSRCGQATDCEGADFRGANLRGADFSGASLFGATFTPETPEDEQQQSAKIDATTKIEARAIEQLTPIQQAFVEKALNQ